MALFLHFPPVVGKVWRSASSAAGGGLGARADALLLLLLLLAALDLLPGAETRLPLGRVTAGALLRQLPLAARHLAYRIQGCQPSCKPCPDVIHDAAPGLTTGESKGMPASATLPLSQRVTQSLRSLIS